MSLHSIRIALNYYASSLHWLRFGVSGVLCIDGRMVNSESATKTRGTYSLLQKILKRLAMKYPMPASNPPM